MEEYLREDLRLKCEMQFHHFGTLLRRTQLFLIIETALLYGMFNEDTTPKEAFFLCVAGFGAASMWFLFAARDFVASNVYQEAIKQSRDEIRQLLALPMVLQDLHVLPKDFAYPATSKKSDIREIFCEISKPQFGVRWLGIVLPLIVALFWMVLLFAFVIVPMFTD